MADENISQEFRLKSLGEARNYLIEEINRNELISKSHKKVSRTLNYIEQFFILDSIITGCISVFTFSSLVGISIGITSSAIELRVCVITASIKKCQSIIKK